MWFRWPIRWGLVSCEPNNPSLFLPLCTFSLGVRTKGEDWSLFCNNLTFVCCSDQQHPSGPAWLLHCSYPTRLKRTIFDNRWGWDLCLSETTLFQGQQILTGLKWWLKTGISTIIPSGSFLLWLLPFITLFSLLAS